MYTLRCPHCDNDIELLGQKDLTAEYKLTPNKVLNRMEKDEMPEPALSFENRRLWTRQQIEEFHTREGQHRVQVLLHETEDMLSALPEEQRELFLQALLAQAKEPDASRK